MEGATCPHCGASNPFGELFCQRCYRRLPRPSPEPMESILEAKAADERRKWRRDLAVSAAFSAVMGLGTLVLSDAAPPGSMEREAGRQLWWLSGILWGFVLWAVRRWVVDTRE